LKSKNFPGNFLDFKPPSSHGRFKITLERNERAPRYVVGASLTCRAKKNKLPRWKKNRARPIFGMTRKTRKRR
jgi:hypothetical protein